MNRNLLWILTIAALASANVRAGSTTGYLVGKFSFVGFDYTTGELGTVFPINNPFWSQCAVTRDGSGLYVASASEGTKPFLSLVSTSTGAVLRTFPAIPAPISKMVLGNNDTVLYASVISGDEDAIVKLDVASGKPILSVHPPNLPFGMALSPDEATLFVSTALTGVTAYNTSDFSIQWALKGVPAGLLTTNPDGAYLYDSGGDIHGPSYPYVVVFDTKTAQPAKVDLPETSNSELLTVFPPSGTLGVTFSANAISAIPYNADVIDSTTNTFQGPFLPTTSDGYTPFNANRAGGPIPIQFAPDGTSVWVIELCTTCSANKLVLNGYRFPDGKLTASTPLPGVFNTILFPQ